MPNWTPGPWSIRWKPVTVSIHAPNGDYITENVRKLPNQDANANLITAAPDLYEALRGMVAWFHCQQQRAPLAQAEAALRKADGQ